MEKACQQEECIFCKFAKGEIEVRKIYENKYVFAFLDINPCGTLEGHTLVVSKCHKPTIEEIDEKHYLETMKAVKMLVPAIKEVSGADGINILQNNGKAAGQFVMHYHVHIIPRKFGDGIIFDEKRRVAKPMELEEVAKAIKAKLEAKK